LDQKEQNQNATKTSPFMYSWTVGPIKMYEIHHELVSYFSLYYELSKFIIQLTFLLLQYTWSKVWDRDVRTADASVRESRFPGFFADADGRGSNISLLLWTRVTADFWSKSADWRGLKNFRIRTSLVWGNYTSRIPMPPDVPSRKMQTSRLIWAWC